MLKTTAVRLKKSIPNLRFEQQIQYANSHIFQEPRTRPAMDISPAQTEWPESPMARFVRIFHKSVREVDFDDSNANDDKPEHNGSSDGSEDAKRGALRMLQNCNVWLLNVCKSSPNEIGPWHEQILQILADIQEIGGLVALTVSLIGLPNMISNGNFIFDKERFQNEWATVNITPLMREVKGNVKFWEIWPELAQNLEKAQESVQFALQKQRDAFVEALSDATSPRTNEPVIATVPMQQYNDFESVDLGTPQPFSSTEQWQRVPAKSVDFSQSPTSPHHENKRVAAKSVSFSPTTATAVPSPNPSPVSTEPDTGTPTGMVALPRTTTQRSAAPSTPVKKTRSRSKRLSLSRSLTSGTQQAGNGKTGRKRRASSWDTLRRRSASLRERSASLFKRQKTSA